MRIQNLSRVLFTLLAGASVLAATEEQIRRSLPIPPGGTVVVEVPYGTVQVSTGKGAAVEVDAWRKVSLRGSGAEKEYLAEHPVSLETEGTTVLLRVTRDRGAGKGWGFGRRLSARYVLQVPEDCSVRVKTAGGSVEVDGPAGSVEAVTSGGGLRLSNIGGRVTGRTAGGSVEALACHGGVEVVTSGGSIRATDIEGGVTGKTAGGSIRAKGVVGPVDLTTAGGSIRVEARGGAVRAATSGGSITAELPGGLAGDVHLSTSGGGVTVRVPEGSGFRLDAAASGSRGSCISDFALPGLDPEGRGDRLRGEVHGGGPEMHLRTSGGKIRLERAEGNPAA